MEKRFYGKSNSDWFDSLATYVPQYRAPLNVTRVLVKLRLQEPSPLARHGSINKKRPDCISIRCDFTPQTLFGAPKVPVTQKMESNDLFMND